MSFHMDDRGQRIFDIFPVLNGQINITHVNSTSHIVAWHMHMEQTDYFYCVKGSFKVGLCDQLKGTITWEYISDKNPTKIIIIPPGIWHGYKALEPGSIMLYYLTKKYDNKDEYKQLPGAFEENWETQNK